MKNLSRYFYFTSLLITIAFTTAAFADVKVKSKQTASGQTYEHTTYIKGKRQRSEQNMGSVQMVNLTQCDLKRYVQINPNSKTYIINLFNQAVEATNQNVSANSKDGVVRAGGTVTSTVTYKDTGEKKKMFGYDARRIITTMETASSPDACSPHNSKMQIDGWYILAAFALDCDWGTNPGGYGGNQKGGCQDKYQMKTIGNAKRGFPVYEKMTMFDTDGKEIMSSVTEVVELSQATLDASLFEIPADYREVKNMSEMYSATSMNYSSNSNSQNSNPSTSSATAANIKNQAQSNNDVPSTVGAKKAGVVRIGLTSVKVGAVGEHLTAADLAAAIQNTLSEYLKGTNIEVVQLEAKLASAVESEARQKECDYILNANVSHKKGGGGFGMFSSMVAQGVSTVGYGTGSRVGSVVGQVAAQTIITASTMSANVKSKDEITLEVKMNAPGGSAAVLTKQAKAKAKADGEDIITPVVEQIAQAIFNTVAK